MTIHVLGISNIINNVKEKKNLREEKLTLKNERKMFFLILLTVTRTRTNYYNFCRFNIFNIHCDTFFSGLTFYLSQVTFRACKAGCLECLKCWSRNIFSSFAVNCDNSVFREEKRGGCEFECCQTCSELVEWIYGVFKKRIEKVNLYIFYKNFHTLFWLPQFSWNP